MTEKEKEGRLYKEISKNIDVNNENVDVNNENVDVNNENVDVNNKNVDVNIILKKIKQKYPKLRKNYINIIEVIYKNNTITQEEIALTLGKSKNSIYRNLKVLKI